MLPCASVLSLQGESRTFYSCPHVDFPLASPPQLTTTYTDPPRPFSSSPCTSSLSPPSPGPLTPPTFSHFFSSSNSSFFYLTYSFIPFYPLCIPFPPGLVFSKLKTVKRTRCQHRGIISNTPDIIVVFAI